MFLSHLLQNLTDSDDNKAIKLQWLILVVVTGNKTFAEQHRVEALYGRPNRNDALTQKDASRASPETEEILRPAKVKKAVVDESMEPKVPPQLAETDRTEASLHN